jgi:hypothetical protein
MTIINYAPYIRKAAEAFQKHGKPNQASILRDAADAFEEMQRSQTEETDEFNAGFDAAQRGEPIVAEPNSTPYDVWRIGWVWGKYQKEQAIIQNIANNKTAIQTVLYAEKAKAAG